MNINALQKQFDSAAQAVEANQFDEALTQYSTILEVIASKKSTPKLEQLKLDTLLARGLVFRKCNFPKLAQLDFEQWYKEGEPGPQLVDVLDKMVIQWFHLGQHREAVGFLQDEAMARLSEYPSPIHEATIYRSLGSALTFLGRLEEATNYLKDSIRLYEEADDIDQVVRAGNSLGIAYLRRGELDKAIKTFQKSLAIYRERSDKPFETAIILNNLGECYQNLYDMEQALAYHLEALQLLEEVEELKARMFIIDLYRNIGVDLHNQGQIEEGVEYITRALHLCETTKQSEIQLQAMASLALANYKLGNSEKAQRYAQEAFDLANESQARPHLARALYVIGLCYQQQGDTVAAEQAWQEAVFLAHETGQKSLLWQIHAAMSDAQPNDSVHVHQQIAREVIYQIAEPIEDFELREKFLQAPTIQSVLAN